MRLFRSLWLLPRAFLLEYLPNSLKKFYQHDSLTYGAALAFFFLLSIFPLLIFLASALAYIPVPDLFTQIVHLMSLVIPTNAMGRIRVILAEILQTNLGLLSFGIAGAIWIASAGFDALIGVLDRVFEVQHTRPYWKRRLLAVGLTLLIGVMVVLALLAGVLGPFLGSLLPKILGVHSLFLILWPYVRWTAIVLFLILSLQLMYMVAPSHRHTFLSQTPGAVLAILVWIGISFLLNWYVARFVNYKQIYGALGAVIALLIWFYVTALAILLGAELNAELIRQKRLNRASDREPLAAGRSVSD
jgi:membrane protein